MKIAIEKPDVIRFIYRQEREDPGYGSCLWAYFDIDRNEGMLSIQSDCGNYAHSWPETGKAFIKLLAGDMAEGYLLEKLCGKPRRFNQRATIENVKEYLNDAEYYDDEDLNREKIEEAIKDLKRTYDEYDLREEPGIAEFIIDEWNNDNDMGIECIWERVAREYSSWQKRIVQIFRKYIVPEIRQALKEGAFDGKNNEG